MALLASPRPAGAEPTTHAVEQRVAYIAGALVAVRATPPESLRQANDYARALARGACASSVPRLKVECLMTASRRYCKGRPASETSSCAADMDVIASNLLGESQLVSTEKRYQIMTRYKDYRRELLHELRRVQGALAVDFRLRMGDSSDDDARLAKQIDQYCVATADDTNMAWPTCVSSLVWFIAGGGE